MYLVARAQFKEADWWLVAVKPEVKNMDFKFWKALISKFRFSLFVTQLPTICRETFVYHDVEISLKINVYHFFSFKQLYDQARFKNIC